MVICQFYLKGMCKFGDRCRNEHRKPDNRGGYDDHYNQGYRGHQNYNQDRKGGGGGGQGRYGGGDQGYDDYNNQGYRNNQNYNQDRKGGGGRGGEGRGHGHYDGGGQSRHGGGGGQGRHGGGGQGRYDDGGHGRYDDGRGRYDDGRGQGRYGGNQAANDGYRGGGNDKYHYDARNTGNSNRFTALSHQPDPEMPNFDQRSHSRGRTNSLTSHHSATPDINLERAVKKGIQDWDEGGQWPLSCFSPIPNDICFAGLVDISPEEVRVEAYKANAEGNSQSYVQSLQQTIEKYNFRKRELANMSLSSLQQEMSKSSQPNNATSAGLFGGIASASSAPFGGNQTSIFGNTQPATPTSSAELFPSQSSSGSGPFSSTPFDSTSKQVTFANTLPATNTPGLFGDASSSTAHNSQPLFGTSKTPHPNISEVQTSNTTSDSRQPIVAPLKCSEQDLKAFKADHFVLGAIPECPPPLELC